MLLVDSLARLRCPEIMAAPVAVKCAKQALRFDHLAQGCHHRAGRFLAWFLNSIRPTLPKVSVRAATPGTKYQAAQGCSTGSSFLPDGPTSIRMTGSVT